MCIRVRSGHHGIGIGVPGGTDSLVDSRSDPNSQKVTEMKTI